MAGGDEWPKDVDKFIVFQRELGRGSYTMVRLGKNRETDAMVAVKMTKISVDVDSLFSEDEILRKVAHPNIVPVVDAFTHDNVFYLITNFVEGGTLLDLIGRRRRICEPAARDIFRQLAGAVAHCHACQVAHRDIKLENVMLDPEGRVVLLDFGFAVIEQPTDPPLCLLSGSVDYAAPELILVRAHSSFPVDVWALGVLLFVLVQGTYPFAGDPMTMRDSVRFASPRWRTPTSIDLSSLINGMLAKDPKDRLTASAVLSHPWLAPA